MKRFGNLWKDVVTEDNGVKAIIDGTKHKRWQRAVKWLLYDGWMVDIEPNLWHRIDTDKATEYADYLIAKLQNGTWEHKAPRYKRQFCKNRSNGGKWRDLYIPCLDDHIVAHMVMNVAMPAFTKGMHPHCCGSVPKRGIKHVVDTVSNWMQNDRQCRYFVKLDIRKFFDNIDRDKLLEVLESKIKDEQVIEVFRKIIDSAPIACPVGYYTSPWFANLYLEKLDWYVEQELFKERRGKRIKYVRHYLRYVDDILLIGTSKADLNKAVNAIKEYLLENYGLYIKDSWEIKKIGKHETVNGEWKLKKDTYWCDLGGYKFCKDCTILRSGIYLYTKRLASKMQKQGYYTTHQCQSINSRIGWASHCDSHALIYELNDMVDIGMTRRIIGDVDKNRKRREY